MASFSEISNNFDKTMRELAEKQAQRLREDLAKASQERLDARLEVIDLKTEVQMLTWKLNDSPWNAIVVEQAQAKAAKIESENLTLRANAAIQAARLNEAYRDSQALKAKIAELVEACAEADKESCDWFVIADDAFDQFDERENSIRALVWENKFLREITTEARNELFQMQESENRRKGYNDLHSQLQLGLFKEQMAKIAAAKAEVEALRAALTNPASTVVTEAVEPTTPARKVPGDKQRKSKHKAKARKGRQALRDVKRVWDLD